MATLRVRLRCTAKKHCYMTQVTDHNPNNSDPNQTLKRKDDHIRINMEKDVQFPHLTSGLERYRFMHEALPELDIAEIDTSVSLFNKRLKSPILISSMTGGTEMARGINRKLAEAAQQTGIAMGLGSQRAAIER